MASDFDGEVDVPADAIQIIDERVLEHLPAGTKGKNIKAYGASYWTRTARLDVQLADGSIQPYFLKVSLGERGKAIMSGEFASMSALTAAAPGLVPQPIGWGTYSSNPEYHFFLCAFHYMALKLPEIKSFSSELALLHTNGISPNGKYGFGVTTFQGNLPQDNRWKDTWEEFYIQGMKRMLQLEEETQGPSERLSELCPKLFEKVIPRLLRPLETFGNSIKPSLVHGDLWYGNAAVDRETKSPIIFDACCFYAHSEYELGTWRPARYRFGKDYMEAYHQIVPPSEPREDQDDRNALYSIRFNLHASALYTGNNEFRPMIIDEIQRLVDKYPGGYEEWAEARMKAKPGIKDSSA